MKTTRKLFYKLRNYLLAIMQLYSGIERFKEITIATTQTFNDVTIVGHTYFKSIKFITIIIVIVNLVTLWSVTKKGFDSAYHWHPVALRRSSNAALSAHWQPKLPYIAKTPLRRSLFYTTRHFDDCYWHIWRRYIVLIRSLDQKCLEIFFSTSGLKQKHYS